MTTASDKKYYVYVHVRGNTGHVFYVGKGKGKRSHSQENRNKYWRRIVASTGYSIHILSRHAADEEACAQEVRMIAAYRSIGMAEANLTNGGDGTSGYVYTEEHRRNLSAALKGKMAGSKNPMRRPEVAAKMGATKLGNKNCVKWDEHNFYHEDYGSEYCSGYELRNKYSLNQSYVSKLLSGVVKSCKGWVLVDG